jgi:hypothetical protein
MTPAKQSGPKLGEIGLAKFHRIVGGAAGIAALCMMLASVTALYWFGGVIGLPPAACVLVAISFEVMAASQAASATTAKNADGKPDRTAWVAYGFFVSVTAFANIIHAITFLKHTYGKDAPPLPPAPTGDVFAKLFTNAGATLPDGWGDNTAFIVAACVFAAACAFGGSFGVHRFGWLRGNGADAEWTTTEDGSIATNAPAPNARSPKPGKPARERSTEQKQPERERAPERAPERSPERAPERAPERSPERAPAPAVALEEWETRALALFDASIAQDPTAKPDAAAIFREVNPPRSESAFRKRINKWWNDRQDGADEPTTDLRRELHAADPPETGDVVDPPNEKRRFDVA